MTSGAMKVPNERQTNMVNFMKNPALAGGALARMGVEEPWKRALRWVLIRDSVNKSRNSRADLPRDLNFILENNGDPPTGLLESLS
jgi:hypothetical protein